MEDIIKSIHEITRKWVDMDYIKTKDIPNIDLYMDQVTTFIDENLSKTKRFEDDKILTKTMINNYTKNDLLPPPTKKKYSKEHMLFLIFIYFFKHSLSINDIQNVLEPIAESFYYKDKKRINLESIYEEIINIQKNQYPEVEKDIEKKIEIAKNAFADVKNADKDLLFLFSFISLINFENYMKKHIVEKLIDEYLNEEDEE
ncbi:MAG: DUF1836 domain-containing protein [Eubacteriales bacterium]